jgi:hypothetical protein
MPTQPAILGAARLNNFRLGYLTVAQRTHLTITIGGIEVTQPDAPMRVIYKSLTIRDLLFDAPNTCALTLYGPTAPTVGQPIAVWLNANDPVLLFGGELQTVENTYKGRPTTVLHPVTAIDDTARANRRRPLLPYFNTSASTIARELIEVYAPGFSTAGVEADLPPVSITFDGSEAGMKGCLTALAKLVGAYWYFENKTLYFFVTPPGQAPDPIDATPGRFLHDPAITWAIDKSQVRTRVFGKGASTRISTTIAAGTDLVPIVNAEMFTPTGGQAIAGITPDGAACRVLTYTGVQFGGGGGLVGPGAAPSAAPTLVPIDGAGIESGTHSYAVTFTTAAGESLPGPVATITVGLTAQPATPPVPGQPTAGGSVDAGTHYYAVTFVTASGETTSPGITQGVTTTVGDHLVVPPTGKPTLGHAVSEAGGTNNWNVGDVITYRVTFLTPAGETTAGPASNGLTAVANPLSPGYCKLIDVSAMPVSPDPGVTGKRYYRYRNGASQGYNQIPNGWDGVGADGGPLTPGSPPGTNTANVTGTNYQTVPLTGILTGPANVTARRLYRYSGAGPYKLLTTIANNTATTYTDTQPSSALGVGLPMTNTATANRVGVTLPTGGASVTGRKLYRSAANLTPLKFLTLLGDNTTTAYTDASSDAALGAAAPASDTSGLTQPNGQVPAGSTSLILANPAPFAAGGGWAVVGNGEQVVRYTGKSATALTGIPATGPGAIVASISYNSTVTAAPALVGVTGITVLGSSVPGVIEAIIRNSPIHVWVQRDDTAAQADMIALDGGGDGVYEHIWSDERRSEASLKQVCDAQLKLYSRPLVTVTYASRDQKTKSGKTVAIALASPAINESLTIQDVTITEIGIAGLAPKFTVTASTARQSFENILQMLIRKADA